MKRMLLCIALLVPSALVSAQSRTHQQGTIVRMRMTDCLAPQHGFMANMSGAGRVESGAPCPEYVLVSEKVVYVLSGKGSDQILPLADTTRFRMQKNELLIRVDDAPKETHFHIKEMMLRQEWERNQMLEDAEASAMITRHLDPTAMREPQ